MATMAILCEGKVRSSVTAAAWAACDGCGVTMALHTLALMMRSPHVRVRNHLVLTTQRLDCRSWFCWLLDTRQS